MKTAPLLALLLASACWALPPKVASEPAAQNGLATSRSLSKQVQGGLVDLRYGQVCVDIGGEATVLELPSQAKVLLDGKAISPEELLKRIPEGLGVVATFSGADGIILALEAFSDGAKVPGAALTLVPLKGPAYRQGDLLTVVLSNQEVKRLGGSPLTLTAPGLRPTAFVPAQRGGQKATVRTSSDTNLVSIPLLVRAGEKVFTGPKISVATKPPVIRGYGPQNASAELSTIPGWLDLQHPPKLLDLTSAKLRASEGARIVKFQPRIDRTVFELEVEGPGEYWLEFEIADVLGNVSRQRWPIFVRP